MTDIIVAGHLCLDLLPAMANVSLEQMPSPGKLFEVDPLTIATGGAVSNTGLALHRLGVNVGLMSAVGDDLLGRVIVASIKDRDPALAENIHVRAGSPSSYTIALSPGNSDRIFLHCTGTNAEFSADDIDYDAVGKAKIFHFGYPPILPRMYADDGAELTTIYQQAKATGVITSLDMSLPDPNAPSGQANWRKIIENTLPYVDIFIPSIEEIIFMLRRDDHEAWGGDVLSHINQPYLRQLGDEVLAMGAVITGFKLGEMGYYLRTGDDPARIAALDRLSLNASDWAGVDLYHPAFQVEVGGTTGAGDSSYAGVLAALLKGLSPQETIQWAAAVGACNVEKPDAVSGVRTWDDTQARLDAGWQQNPLSLPES